MISEKYHVEPCPFCGEAEDFEIDHEVIGHGASIKGTWLLCRECDARGPEGDDTVDAIERWNERI